ncbi:MAG: transposase [Chthoniobacteraceae bacterium]
MRSRYRILEPHAPHFITATIVEWLPVFTTPGCCDILIRSLKYCREHKALRIHGWVIMENHFHAVLSGPDLAATLESLKRFTAHEIIPQLGSEGRKWLLNQLAHYRAGHKKATREHQVWQEGSHPQAILTDETMRQKLDYLHNNPVKRGWVASQEHWRYSSAHEWLPGAVPVLQCDPWRQADDTECR